MPTAKARKIAKPRTKRAKATGARKTSAHARNGSKALLTRKSQRSVGNHAQKPRAPASPPAATPVDAIDLLKADHREVEALFAQFEKATSSQAKTGIVGKICDALTAHMRIEEEIFYGAARAAMKAKGEDMVDEAEEEHEGIKWKVAELKSAGPSDERYDAKVNVLKEYVQHHVKEEEREFFPKLRRSDFDSEAVGEKLAARKEALTGIPVKRPPASAPWGFRALLG